LPLILLAGAGDELQGIKRGIMEFVDIVAVNKADGDNVARAESARLEAEHALHFFPPSQSGWTPRAVACSAVTGRGIGDLWELIREFAAVARDSGYLERNRREQNRQAMHLLFDRGLRRLILDRPGLQLRMAELEQAVLAGRTTPGRAAEELLEAYADAATPERSR